MSDMHEPQTDAEGDALPAEADDFLAGVKACSVDNPECEACQ